MCHKQGGKNNQNHQDGCLDEKEAAVNRDNYITWDGNGTTIDPDKTVVPNYLMNAVTESMDDIDGDGPPVISEENVLQAKDFVDNRNKL